tara:strand:- start:1196 stop:2023 length:828 start_codon:yes stop_codon:yes gene_type:complete
MIKKYLSKLIRTVFSFLGKNKLEKILEIINNILGISNNLDTRNYDTLKTFFKDKKINTVIEVGTLDGNNLLKLSKQFEINKIISFNIFNELNQELMDNENVTIENFALGDVIGNKEIYFNENKKEDANFLNRNLHFIDAPDEETKKVEMTTFDSYYSKNLANELVDILILDVNGYELNVLEGSVGSLDYICCINFSMNSFQVHSKNHFKDYFQFFKEHNFELFKVTSIGPQHIKKYKEVYESVDNVNYLAFNKKFLIKIIEDKKDPVYVLRENLK